MTFAVKSINQLPFNGNPQLNGEIEFEHGGTNYRVPLSILLQVFADYAQANTPTTSKPYWQTTPVYSINEVKEIVIEAGGVAVYGGSSHNTPASSTLVVADLEGVDTQRFDALLYDSNTEAYTLLSGVESENPITPAYNSLRYLLVGYIHSTPEGTESSGAPASHAQNTDQYLDFGGVNQVSAFQAKSVFVKMLDYIGRYLTPEALTTGQTSYQFAMVMNPLSLWLYDPNTQAWTQVGGGTSGGSTGRSFMLSFDDYTTVSPVLVFKGAKSGISVVKTKEISSYSFEAKLDSASTYTALADVTALQTWVTTNVTTENTVWNVRVLVTFIGGFLGETSLNFSFS
jgi:hypothetical protein